jgi:ACT domain-containing protein
MRMSAATPLGRWRRICASRQTLQEHSGIVSPVWGQIAMLDLSIATIARNVNAPEAAKVALPRLRH